MGHQIVKAWPDLASLRHAMRQSTTPKMYEEYTRIEARSRAWGEGWGTHVPLLAAIVAVARSGAVLELGTGHFSTPLLAAMCKAMKRQHIAYEPNAEWRSASEDLLGRPWLDVATDTVLQSKRWAVIFLDSQPDNERRSSLERAMQADVEFIVCHDTRNPYMNIDDVLDRWPHRYDYTHMTSCTSVISRTRDCAAIFGGSL